MCCYTKVYGTSNTDALRIHWDELKIYCLMESKTRKHSVRVFGKWNYICAKLILGLQLTHWRVKFANIKHHLVAQSKDLVAKCEWFTSNVEGCEEKIPTGYRVSLCHQLFACSTSCVSRVGNSSCEPAPGGPGSSWDWSPLRALSCRTPLPAMGGDWSSSRDSGGNSSVS